MLSDEEKKAIDELNKPLEVPEDKFNTFILYNIESAKTLINLIKKQSKEIEELNKSDASKEQSSIKYYNLYKELVDKIKAKIEEVKDGTYDAKIVLQSLLRKEFPVTITKEELEKRWKE